MLLLCLWILCYAVIVSLEFALCRHCVFGVYTMPSLCPWGLRYTVTVSVGFVILSLCPWICVMLSLVSLIVGIAQHIRKFLLQGQLSVQTLISVSVPPPVLPQ